MARTGTKAAIRRASIGARKKMRTLDRSTSVELERIYRQASDQIGNDILQAAGPDGSVEIAVLQQLLSHINARLDLLSQSRGDLLESGLADASMAGASSFAEVISPEILASVSHDAVSTVMHFIAGDGLQLSDRVWRIDAHAREVVGNAVTQAVIQGKSATDAAREFMLRGDKVPAELLAKMNRAQATRIQRDAGMALLNDEGSPMRNAMRLFRTEINRAHGTAYQAAAFEHPDVIGTRFLLSPNHPQTDICDMHASVNRYGLGPGVYPQGKSPWPAHPNTLSFEEVVFSDEVSSDDKSGKETRIEWLKSQRAGVQESVLGSRMKRGALESGLLKEGHIATPWNVLKKRYAGQGHDISRLKPLPIEPLSVYGQKAGGKFTSDGSPVSKAFDVLSHRSTAAHTLNVIDSVHGDGVLPVIPIRNAPPSAGYFGAYRHFRSGEAVDIQITAGGSHKELTLAHEVGHFLDHHAIPGKGFSSKYSKQMKAWRDAVHSSRAHKELKALLDGPDFIRSSGGYVDMVSKKYVEYCLETHELWARSYAQWVATRSGDRLLKGQLSDILKGIDRADIAYPIQWTDDDFSGIGKAIDGLVKELGWM